MSKITNFRLDEQTLNTLNELALKMDTTKTGVIKQALALMAEQNTDINTAQNSKSLDEIHPALKYCGIWKDVDVDGMLKEIYASRRSGRSYDHEDTL